MTRPGRFPAVLADPRVQFGVGMAALLATAGAVHRDRVGPREAEAFRAINGLPDSWHRPAWVVMQLGAFGAVPAAASLRLGRNRPAPACRLRPAPALAPGR